MKQTNIYATQAISGNNSIQIKFIHKLQQIQYKQKSIKRIDDYQKSNDLWEQNERPQEGFKDYRNWKLHKITICKCTDLILKDAD